MQDVLISFAVNIDFMINMSAKFNLNPLNLLALALFSWECTLEITEMELKLLTDVNMILNYKNVFRRGIARAICHYAGSNNKYMHDYDETKKVHTFDILILTFGTDGFCHNHFLTFSLNMLNIFQYLHMILL